MSEELVKEWNVILERTVRTCIDVGPCTEEEARTAPYDHMTPEQDRGAYEIGMSGWEVVEVR